MKRHVISSLVILAVFLFMLSIGLSAEKSTDTIVRVLIIDDKDSLHLSLKGRYKIYAANSDRIVMEGPYLTGNVRPTKDGLQIGKKELKIYGVKVKTIKSSNIYVDGRRLRGDIDIVRKENKKLMVINYVALDEYLYGVLYHEVSHRWPIETLKAQAIAARTFALYQARQNKLQPYDLRSDVYSQVYGGKNSERWATTRAVNLTKGKVLTYNGDIFPAYYHATCAGYTEDASNLWNIDMPPLKGVECNFCKYSKHYRWKREIPLMEIENKLRENSYKIGRIGSIAILSKNKSGRVDKIEIKDESGVSCVLTGKDFRQMLGPNDIRSTKFDVSLKWNQLIVEGLGWGHGVGMCQWGAYGQGKRRKRCEEILKFYYPGAEVTNLP